MPRTTGTKRKPRRETGERPAAGADYLDFMIYCRRASPDTVRVRAQRSSGAMSDPATVSFPEAEALELQRSFRTGFDGGGGRARITRSEAGAIGHRLASVLFPAPVFQLFAQCFAAVVHGRYAGLRVRLALDPSLMDLPWEYVHRPDRPDAKGVSGFLLLDPTVSLVREAAHPLASLEPITGRQRLAFVGALWEDGRDLWEVHREFARLRAALSPVSPYIVPKFAPAASAFDQGILEGAAILHYAGHCDFDRGGEPYLILQVPGNNELGEVRKLYVRDLARAVQAGSIRLAMMNGCNGGSWAVVEPLLDAGVPAVIGINGQILSPTTIEFCAKLYESLAVGLTLDEAVVRARLHVLKWDEGQDLFDWGLFMVYMRSPQAALFPRPQSRSISTHQRQIRQSHQRVVAGAIKSARDIDGMNFSEIASNLTRRRVLILGRFTGRRLAILEAMKDRLSRHAQGYQPELFTYARPDQRNLIESIVGFASMSRFIIADLSEPKSIPSELQAIVPVFPSIPVAPVISRTGREYATFDDIRQRPNVVPVQRYRDRDDLLDKLDQVIVPQAEAKLRAVQPTG